MTSEQSPHPQARSGRRKPILLTIEEAAERMGVGVRFMRRLIDERRIPVVKLGERKTRLDEDDVDAFIAAARVEPPEWGPHRKARGSMPATHPAPRPAAS